MNPKRVYTLFLGKKKEYLVPFWNDRRLWVVVRDGWAFKRGDIVCARRPIAIEEASRAIACWRTLITPRDLVCLRPLEGWKDEQKELAEPYASIWPWLSVIPGGRNPDPPRAA